MADDRTMTARPQLDRATLQRFAAGDLDALGTVFDRYSRAVWSVCMSVLRDRQLADDATQEAFLRAFRFAERYDPERPLGPWLLTLARRAAIDAYRHESRPTRGGHAVEQDRIVEPPGIEQAWSIWQVRLALQDLSDEERAVIRMSHYEGLTHPEIAESLGVPVGTVKSRSHRAHRKLAGLLAHLEDSQQGGDA